MDLASLLQADPSNRPWRQRLPQPQLDMPGQVWHPGLINPVPPTQVDEHGNWYGPESGQWLKSMAPPPAAAAPPEDFSYLLRRYQDPQSYGF